MSLSIDTARLLLFVLLYTSGACAKAEGFETSGDQQKLADQTIVASENISEFYRLKFSLDSPQSLGQKQEPVYQVGQFCFATSEDMSGKAGLLLIDQYSNVSVATLSTYFHRSKLA